MNIGNTQPAYWFWQFQENMSKNVSTNNIFSIFFLNLSKIQILALEFRFHTNLMEFMGANLQENNGIWTWAYDLFSLNIFEAKSIPLLN